MKNNIYLYSNIFFLLLLVAIDKFSTASVAKVALGALVGPAVRTGDKPGTKAAAGEKLAPVHRKYFSGFGLEDIDPDGLTIRNYKKGELLCEQGSPLDEMLIITGGRVKVCSMAANGKTLLSNNVFLNRICLILAEIVSQNSINGARGIFRNELPPPAADS